MSYRFVTRLADYEPQPVLAGLPSTCRTPKHGALHQPSRTSPHAVHHRRREQSPQTAHAPLAPPPQAAAFADAAMRRVLEAMDRRRPMAQLRPLLADGPFSAVMARAARTPAATTARLCKLRVRACDDTTAEIFGTFGRGKRVRAFAGRIQHTHDRWLIVALQMG